MATTTPYVLDPGRLRQRVQLQRRTTVTDERGGSADVWTTYACTWADVRPVRGRDFVAAAQPQATFDCMVVMRWRTDVLPADRVLWGAQPLEVVGQPINVQGLGVAMELMCTHGVRSGAAA
jgi:SPP1 family predicted phage head-tail adaptor